MAIEALGQVAQNQGTSLQSTGIGQDDFLKIMLTQLNYQDPLKPMDNQQFIAQMAQFASLEQSRQMNERLDLLLSVQSASQSIGLIGRTVQVATAAGSTVGQVVALDFSGGEPQLTVKTSSGEFIAGLSLGQVATVR